MEIKEDKVTAEEAMEKAMAASKEDKDVVVEFNKKWGIKGMKDQGLKLMIMIILNQDRKGVFVDLGL